MLSCGLGLRRKLLAHVLRPPPVLTTSGGLSLTTSGDTSWAIVLRSVLEPVRAVSPNSVQKTRTAVVVESGYKNRHCKPVFKVMSE